MRHLHCALLMLLAASFADSRRHASAGQGVEGGAVTFEQDVRPILKTHCFQCHGEEANPRGGLDLRLVRLMKVGGDSGGAMVPGQPDRSLLFQRIRDGEMPPEERKQLTAVQIQRIRQWIADGARTVREEPQQLDEGPLITPEERAHWACQPIIRPHVPRPRRVELVSNPIDAFLLVKLEEQALSFSPPAAKRTLMRRVYLDLLGLPPRPEDVTRFASNNDSLAWNRLIDRLLASPHYGERWATHWLDAAGYADSEGYTNTDAERPHAWRYRDYVIRSLNIDKPFGQFIREQLAGDELVQPPYEELTPEDVEKLTATGFLRMVPDGSAANVPDSNVARNAVIADTIQVVSTSLLGLTVGCAQCHDHRYDPISQEDYYRMRAIFAPAFDWQQWRTPQQRLVSLYTAENREQAEKIETEAKWIDQERSRRQQEFILATLKRELAKLPEEVREAARTAYETAAKQRTAEQKALLKQYPSLNVSAGSLYLYDSKAAQELKALAEKARQLRDSKPRVEFVRALTEIPDRVPVTHLFYRGDHEQPKQPLEPAGLTVVSLNAELPDIPARNPRLATTGRRLAFADRITSPQYPLTARVIVNRVWLHHFGRGLVATPGDFGALGTPPTHPQLLDWLAWSFIDSGWSLKTLHRLILTSTAWRQQLRTDPHQERTDPDNLFYGGARLRRVDAEVVRDSILAVNGDLYRKPFGPAVPVMPDRVGRFVIGKENLNAGRPGAIVPMHGEDFRRSIYVQVRRSRPLSLLKAFDRPDMAPNCDMRQSSTSSTQSLLMMNSDLMVEYSRKFADRVRREAGDNADRQIERAWQWAYARHPAAAEMNTALAFLADQTAGFAAQAAGSGGEKGKDAVHNPKREALAVLCQMLMSSNEFLYID